MGGVYDLRGLRGLLNIYAGCDFDFSKGLEYHGGELCYEKDDDREGDEASSEGFGFCIAFESEELHGGKEITFFKECF